MNKRPSPKVGKMARDIREIMLFNNKLKFDNDDLKFADAVRITRMKEMYSYIEYLEKKVKHLEKTNMITLLKRRTMERGGHPTTDGR